jgi:hypothetical protein
LILGIPINITYFRPTPSFRKVLERTGCLEIIGADAVFPTRAKAIEAIHHKAHEGVDEHPCPLIEVVEICET